MIDVSLGGHSVGNCESYGSSRPFLGNTCTLVELRSFILVRLLFLSYWSENAVRFVEGRVHPVS